MEHNIYKFIIKYSKAQQIAILIFTAASLPFYYVSLDIPKKIVNGALDTTSESYLKPLEFFGIEVIQLDRLPLLFTLCGLFLALVFINGGFKYFINVYKGLLGERMLRRLRYQLYAHILRFPLPHFRKVSQGELIPMITAEVEPLGGFIGDAFVLPMYQGGLLVTALVFIFGQDPVMGLAAISLYPLQGYLIPKLQRRVNELGKQRVKEVRKLSERITETVSGIQEIHSNDTTRYELADFAYRLGRIFHIRYMIYHKKFFVKFVNNFLNQLTPFFFYSIGGYLVITNKLSLGALVAVLAAYKDLAPPWRELLNYYQMKENARIKYEQVITQFEPPGMLDDALFQEPETIEPLRGELAARGVSLILDDVRVIDGVSFTTPLDQRLALVGIGNSGKEDLALVLARLIFPSAGHITVGERNLLTLPEAVVGRRMAFVGANTSLISASIGENLFYGLKHRPHQRDDDDDGQRERDRAEALQAGNTTDNVFDDWIDYEAANASSREALVQAALAALAVAEFEDDVYQFGLRGTIDPSAVPDVAERVLAARRALRERLAEPDVADLVEPFDRDRYNTNATVAENLLFGNPIGDTFNMDHLAENAYVLQVLDTCSLTHDMLVIGHEVAETMVELFSDLPPGHEFFEQFSFISADDLPYFKALCARVPRDQVETLEGEDRTRILSLPFRLVPARHALGLIDEPMQARLLQARKVFARDLPPELASAVEFFDPARYNAAASLQDNILFGKIRYGKAKATLRIGAVIGEIIDHLGLRPTVVEVGLNFEVGIGGARLSVAQRQKVAIARAVLKHPDVLVLSEATAVLDGAAQNRIMSNLFETFAGRGVIWVLHRPSLASAFDRVLVMQGGRVVENGAYDELTGREDSYFNELLAAE